MSRKIRVLVVDDDNLLRKLIADQLARAEFDAVPVASGKEALEVLREADYDVVLLDIMMPDLSGLDALREPSRSHHADRRYFTVHRRRSDATWRLRLPDQAGHTRRNGSRHPQG